MVFFFVRLQSLCWRDFVRILCVCVWCSFTSGESERGDFLAVPKVLRGCSIVPFENSLPTNFYCNSEQLILNYFISGAMAVEGIADRIEVSLDNTTYSFQFD